MRLDLRRGLDRQQLNALLAAEPHCHDSVEPFARDLRAGHRRGEVTGGVGLGGDAQPAQGSIQRANIVTVRIDYRCYHWVKVPYRGAGWLCG